MLARHHLIRKSVLWITLSIILFMTLPFPFEYMKFECPDKQTRCTLRDLQVQSGRNWYWLSGYHLIQRPAKDMAQREMNASKYEVKSDREVFLFLLSTFFLGGITILAMLKFLLPHPSP